MALKRASHVATSTVGPLSLQDNLTLSISPSRSLSKDSFPHFPRMVQAFIKHVVYNTIDHSGSTIHIMDIYWL